MNAAERLKWLDTLAEAKEPDEWLAVISNAEDQAILGLLRRAGLSEAGLRQDRLDAIKGAIGNGGLCMDCLGAWRDHVFLVKTAIDGIDDFRERKPLVDEFRGAHDLRRGKLEQVLDEILWALWSHILPAQKWVQFLDAKRDLTYRDLFLYRVPALQLKDLALQSYPEFPSSGMYVWRTTEPKLVSIDRQTHYLDLRWVGWRQWGTGRLDEKRCLTCSRIDLDTVQWNFNCSTSITVATPLASPSGTSICRPLPSCCKSRRS
jgi:hypothetical protein